MTRRTSNGPSPLRLGRGPLRHLVPDDVTDAALECRLIARTGNEPGQRRRIEPDWAALAREQKRPGVNLMVPWEEYRETHPEGYGYSRFSVATQVAGTALILTICPVHTGVTPIGRRIGSAAGLARSGQTPKAWPGHRSARQPAASRTGLPHLSWNPASLSWRRSGSRPRHWRAHLQEHRVHPRPQARQGRPKQRENADGGILMPSARPWDSPGSPR